MVSTPGKWMRLRESARAGRFFVCAMIEGGRAGPADPSRL